MPVTALLTTSEGVAMATVLQCDEPAAAEVADVGARAVVVSLGRLALAPPRARIYAVTGGIELGRVGEMTRERLGGVCALILNQAEAVGLTGRADPQEAAIELAGRVETVVITLRDAGALGCAGDEIVFAPAPVVDAVDATGAGDLFTAGYVWADLHGAPLEDRLAWASLYAGISVRAPTAHAGAVALRELLAEGELLGLMPPGQAGR